MRLGALTSHWGSPRRGRLEDFLATLQVVGYTDQLGNSWSQVMLEARIAGRRLESGDGWIAATAMLLDAPLITHDRDVAEISIGSISVVCHG